MTRSTHLSNKKKKLSYKENTVNTKSKLRISVVMITLGFILVTVFLFRWQVIAKERFEAMAASRFTRKEVPALRGDILASDGSVLAYSEPRFDIFVYLDDEHGLVAAELAGRQSRTEFLNKISTALKIDQSEIAETIDSSTNLWVKIANDVDKETRDLVMSIPTDADPDVFIDGLTYEQTAVRIYPEGELAAHVLGYLGQDEFGNYRGSAGLEAYFDGILTPQAAANTLETDSNSNLIALSVKELRESRRGSTLKTTIDKNIQSKVESILADYIQAFRAQSGTVIILDPKTGEVMSLANFPGFVPEEYFKVDDVDLLGNIAVTTPYEIGSVGKVYTMAAAVDQGKIQPNTILIDGHEGCQEIIEERIICTYDKKPQGPLTATQSLIQSDNLALFATAELVGETKLADYLDRFGMGEQTGIQLSGEDRGYIKPGELWNEADLAAYSYGHSYFQTTMQAASGIASLANEGQRMEPLIVTEIIDSDGSRKIYEPRVLNQVVSQESADTMTNIMYEVYLNNLYEDGYKELAKYKIGMKSGTALIPYSSLANPQNIPGYSEEVNSTYVGYDGSEKASFVMLVNVSEPQTSPKLSYNNARILWLEIFKAIKDDLGVPPVME